MTAMNRLQALEHLYAVFADYVRKEHMESCPCRRGPESVRPLYERPLRDLSADDLHLYAFRAMTTMGDADDFRHFLPRILELLCDPEFLAKIDREVVLSKLRYGQWDTWPENERLAVREYLHLLWKAALAESPSDLPYEAAEVGRWLCAIARAESDIAAYLDEWSADGSAVARTNLECFATGYRDELLAGSAPEGYWEDAQAQWGGRLSPGWGEPHDGEPEWQYRKTLNDWEQWCAANGGCTHLHVR